MSIAITMRIFCWLILVLSFVTQQFDVVWAKGLANKRRCRMSLEQRQERHELAQARAASRQSFAEEIERRKREDADFVQVLQASRRSFAEEIERENRENTELAQAVQASLQEMPKTERHVRSRLEVFGDDVEVIEGDTDDSSSTSSVSTKESKLFTSLDIDQLQGLQQQDADKTCGIYALYFARVLSQGRIRNFAEEVDRKAFDAFMADVKEIKFLRSLPSEDVMTKHRSGTMYRQDELVRVAQKLNIQCCVGDLRAGFFDEQDTWHDADWLYKQTQAIKTQKTGATNSTYCVIFNTGEHWITIVITPAKLYLVDSLNCKVRCETDAIHDFITQIWHVK